MANVSSSNGLEKRPKLRFLGFDEPWKATAFGDLVHEFNIFHFSLQKSSEFYFFGFSSANFFMKLTSASTPS